MKISGDDIGVRAASRGAEECVVTLLEALTRLGFSELAAGCSVLVCVCFETVRSEWILAGLWMVMESLSGWVP